MEAVSVSDILEQPYTFTSRSADGGCVGQVDGTPAFSSQILLMMAEEAGCLGTCYPLWI